MSIIKPSSYADYIRMWEKILAAVKENVAKLPSVELHRATLQQILDGIKDAKTRQDSLQAGGQATTQELADLMNQGREAALRLRSAVKADIGPRSEQLTHFNVSPLRKRSRAAAAKPTVPPPPTTPPTETVPPPPAEASQAPPSKT